ncbi:MAG: hypothetical protein GY710_25660 [Desulfobacteraceae bacterium]|nr:hypothetical protein [Desulfobacteraceae bacterium]
MERFYELRREILKGSSPRDFVWLANFRGRLELRRCRIIKSKEGLWIINYKIDPL